MANAIAWYLKDLKAIPQNGLKVMSTFSCGGGSSMDYQAKTDKIGKYMIGMSVPPRMTEQVAKAAIEQWLT